MTIDPSLGYLTHTTTSLLNNYQTTISSSFTSLFILNPVLPQASVPLLTNSTSDLNVSIGSTELATQISNNHSREVHTSTAVITDSSLAVIPTTSKFVTSLEAPLIPDTAVISDDSIASPSCSSNSVNEQPIVKDTQSSDDQSIDTLELVGRVREMLNRYNISQRQFSRSIFKLNYGQVIEMLSRPKSWHRLTVRGRESYLALNQWISNPDNMEMLKTFNSKCEFNEFDWSILIVCDWCRLIRFLMMIIGLDY